MPDAESPNRGSDPGPNRSTTVPIGRASTCACRSRRSLSTGHRRRARGIRRAVDVSRHSPSGAASTRAREIYSCSAMEAKPEPQAHQYPAPSRAHGAGSRRGRRRRAVVDPELVLRIRRTMRHEPLRDRLDGCAPTPVVEFAARHRAALRNRPDARRCLLPFENCGAIAPSRIAVHDRPDGRGPGSARSQRFLLVGGSRHLREPVAASSSGTSCRPRSADTSTRGPDPDEHRDPS